MGKKILNLTINFRKSRHQPHCTLQLAWEGHTQPVLSTSSVSANIRNYTHVDMNLFSHNDRYCHLQKYCSFLPNHSVYKHAMNHIKLQLNCLLKAWNGPEGSRKLRFPYFVTTARDGGKVISLAHRPALLPRKCSWYSFLLETESTPGP